MENTNLTKNVNYDKVNVIVCFANSKDKTVRTDLFHHIIASVLFINDDALKLISAKLDSIGDFYKVMGIDKLHINWVTKKELDSNQPQMKMYNVNPEIVVLLDNFETFFRRMEYSYLKKIIKDTVDNKKLPNHLIFIFEETSWFEILAYFRKQNIIVSGGSTTKRHILSPIDIRLSQFFISVFRGKCTEIINSFHYDKLELVTRARIDMTDIAVKEVYDNNNNNNNKINKIEVESSVNEKNKKNSTSYNSNKSTNTNLQPKREYHSAVRVSENNNKKNKNYIFSYLDSIEEIINNPKYSSIEAQNTIENNWINLIEDKLKDPKFIIDRHSSKLGTVIKEAARTLNNLYANKHIKKKFPLLYEDLNKIDFVLLTFSLVITYYNRLSYTALAMVIGNLILYLIYKNRFVLNKATENNEILFMNYQDFKKSLNLKIGDIFKLGDYFISILSTYPTDLFEREFKISSYYNQEPANIKINSEYLDEIRENIIVHPSSLPMLCEPNKWSDSCFGGFLENKTQCVGIITGSSNHNHKMENKDNLYKAINYLNSIKFCINNLLLNYLLNEGNYLLNEEKEIDNLQREITIKIAKTFSKTPFYLNVHSDWRSRIYTQSFFISYQGGDLSTALINFWEGEILSNEGKYYLYIYGANNHNENNIGKASYSERIQWVKTNYYKIINLDPSLILAAENKFVFTAFCLNMREVHKNPNTIIKLPIFLDATCSGIQHLAALLQDIELGTHVNLIPYTSEEKPGDIYSEIIVPINKALNQYGKEDPNFSNLALVKLPRKILKQSIMTKVYNVTTFGIADQLKSNLSSFKIKESNNYTDKIVTELQNNLKKRTNYYIAPGIKGQVYLTNEDIFKIANIINDQIFVLFPSLNWIYNYFIDITKLMLLLNIPISWFTPAGLKISQLYLKSKQTTVAIKFAGKVKKVVLREWTDIVDKRKQIQAIIPNIIHSLDATHLIKLIIKASEENFAPIITVHDCFGTLPNKMCELDYRVKKEFILLYTQDNFLDKFHNRILQSIEDNQFEIRIDGSEKYVIFQDKYVKIPHLPKLGSLDLQKIIDSKYMIS